VALADNIAAPEAEGRELPNANTMHGRKGFGHAPTTMLTESQHATVELLRYWNLLWARKWVIVGLTLIAAAGLGSYTRFCKQKLYRAEALVTPTAPGDDSDELGISPMGGLGFRAASEPCSASAAQGITW
jgi:uncharacterized protein involved in exopolysaccharide biosynthesis